MNVFQILKDSIGKDLSHFCTPVYLNEPLSILQRLAENYQYSYLLNNAAKEPNQYKRLALIAAFGLSAFSFNQYRTLKSFNPILGETFEYVDNNLNMRLNCEQVSHHPPITACFAEGDGYNIYSNTHAETKLTLLKGCIEFIPIGRTYVNLLDFNEIYTYTKPRVAVKSIIFGKMHLDCYGHLECENRNTLDKLSMELFEESKHKQGSIKGVIKTSSGEEKIKLEGNWLEQLDIIYKTDNKEVRETIWKRNNEPNTNLENKYFFTEYMANLNYLSEEMKEILPPTGSRFRPGQRALEEQNIPSQKKRDLSRNSEIQGRKERK